MRLTLEIKDLLGAVTQYPVKDLDEAVAVVNKEYDGWFCEFAHVLGHCGQLVARMIHPHLPAEVFDRSLPFTPCSLLGKKHMSLDITMPNGVMITLRPVALGHAINVVKQEYGSCRTAYLWSGEGELLARIVHPFLQPKLFHDALRKERLTA